MFGYQVGHSKHHSKNTKKKKKKKTHINIIASSTLKRYGLKPKKAQIINL